MQSCEEIERGSSPYIASSRGGGSRAGGSSRCGYRLPQPRREWRCCSACSGGHRGGRGAKNGGLHRSGACRVLRGGHGCRRRLRRLRAAVGRAMVSAGFAASRRLRGERRGDRARPEATGSVGVCACTRGVAVHVMASSGGVDASRSGRCSARLGPGRAWL